MTKTEIEAYDAMMADRDSWKERFLRLAKEKALRPSDATACSPSSTPIMDAAEGWNDRRDLLAAIGNLELERWKYASQLQTLCDRIVGGTNVTAPFSEVLARLESILPENAERIHGGDETPNPNKTIPAVG